MKVAMPVKSLTCPYDAKTVKPFPKYFSMVLAFAGDSTITRADIFAPNEVRMECRHTLALPFVSSALPYQID